MEKLCVSRLCTAAMAEPSQVVEDLMLVGIKAGMKVECKLYNLLTVRFCNISCSQAHHKTSSGLQPIQPELLR